MNFFSRKLYYADSVNSSIHQSTVLDDLLGNDDNLVINENLGKVTGLAINENKTLYFVNVNTKAGVGKIEKYDLKKKKRTVIFKKDLLDIYGLTIDPESLDLYFSIHNSTNAKIRFIFPYKFKK